MTDEKAAVGRWKELPPGYDPLKWESDPKGPHERGLKPQGGIPGWVIVLAVALVGAVVAALVVAILIPALVGGDDEAKDEAVKEGGRRLQFEIQTWPLGAGASRFPSASQVTQDGAIGDALAKDGMKWPDNPFTGKPMQQGADEGDFTYKVDVNGTDYTLIVYLSGDEPYVLRDGAGE